VSDGTIRCTIGLTENDVLAASLAALGLRSDSASAKRESPKDRVLAAYRAAILELGRPVTTVDVGRRMGICNGRVAAVAAQLVDAGLMVRATDVKTGRTVYFPKAGA